tara:strand:- start:23395 stop:24627 length:1233 start_codon:yes stop_codon:yes gene_type:complete
MILKGTITIDGDKSISHRILIFAALANSKSTIYNLSLCDDVKRTIGILRNCNIKIKIGRSSTNVYPSIIKQRVKKFYCGNSGTTARFMLGFLPSVGVGGTVYGDKSLSKRPMKRLIDPLLSMNIKFKNIKNNLPIQFEKSNVQSIKFVLNHPSAQIKSALIFAALSSENQSTIRDPFKTRNHTENIIKYLGGESEKYKKFIIDGFNYTVPGDISSASFIVAAALLIPGSNINIKNVLFNQRRVGLISILGKMGAKIKISNIRMIQFEKVADINVKYSKLLRSVILSKQDVINMIDEIPVFALIACYASGSTLLNHALELRYKESDRIKAIVYNLKKCGAKISELPDGFVVKKSKLLYSTRIKNFNDHRIAMMCEVLCFISTGRFNNVENKIINTSFPDFYKQISKLYEEI